jgi:hypothetical protein
MSTLHDFEPGSTVLEPSTHNFQSQSQNVNNLRPQNVDNLDENEPSLDMDREPIVKQITAFLDAFR